MKNMPIVGVVFGVILIILGIAGYFGGEPKSITAFIPSVVGLVLLIASAISFKECRLKMGMHIAATIGLLGFVAPFGRIIPTVIKGEFTLGLATGCMIAMSGICLVFVLLCVKSFIDARRGKC